MICCTRPVGLFFKDSLRLQISSSTVLNELTEQKGKRILQCNHERNFKCMQLDRSLSCFQGWLRRNTAFDSLGERSGDNPYEAIWSQIEHRSGVTCSENLPSSSGAAAPAVRGRLMDTRAEESPPRGSYTEASLLALSSAGGPTPSLPLPRGEGLLTDTINFLSAALALNSKEMLSLHRPIIYIYAATGKAINTLLCLCGVMWTSCVVNSNKINLQKSKDFLRFYSYEAWETNKEIWTYFSVTIKSFYLLV